MSGSADIAQEVIGRLGQTSKSLTDPERKLELALGCEAAKETLLRSARDLVAQAGGKPMLASKSCDGTPIMTMHRVAHQQPHGKKIRTAGRQCSEFLVANQFLRTRASFGAGWDTKVIIAEATPLSHGKTVPCILSASRQHWHSLRQLGHWGCAVEHYCFDRAGITALDRETRRWHLEQDTSLRPSHVSDDLANLTEFVVVTACALHDCQNAFKWSMWEDFNNKDQVRDVYIVIESLRRSADLISSHLYAWLYSKLKATADRGEVWVEQRRTLWQTLGIDAETVELMACELQLWWEDGALWFLRGAFEDGDVIDAVASALMAVWRFVKFSESRWLTVGTSARTVIAAVLTGIEDLIGTITKDPKASKFYLRGFQRLTTPRKQFLVSAAVSSRIPESVQCELMEDSRVARTHDDLWKTLAEEMRWIVDISPNTWSLLGSTCGRPGPEVRDVCIGAAHVSFQFIWRRVLVPAAELPWCLVRGDIANNLAELAAGDSPAEPVSERLWLLMRSGFSVEQLVATVELLG